MATSPKYAKQRERQIPPHASLGAIRYALGMTIDEVLARIKTAHPDASLNRGTISAIENGHRGVSPQMLDMLCVGYGLEVGSLSTTYVPRTSRRSAA